MSTVEPPRVAPARGVKRKATRWTFLCATDATPASGAALRTALGLAEAATAALVVVHVVEADGRSRRSKPASRAERQAYEVLVDRQVTGVARRLRQQLLRTGGRADPDVRILVKSGAVVGTVLETASEVDASLVILGKGRTAGAIAPTAERIARAVPRPVLLVPSKWTRGARARALPRRVKARRKLLRAVS